MRHSLFGIIYDLKNFQNPVPSIGLMEDIVSENVYIRL